MGYFEKSFSTTAPNVNCRLVSTESLFRRKDKIVKLTTTKRMQ